ncbi:MAG: hypothetical protein E2591_30470 [Achromobacter sp.]|jgi:hypothetical protein|uniref:hypothetical protein n=1 Tax=Achromobacter TaxID=222 RepID=UPI000F8FACD4|nr:MULTISPECIES: hypothetical protein [Achromobacter]AZS77383.1 hypothetical protein ELS24_02350 [Achromobacter spanius]MPS82392.1 hypothetical protein [Achromobacter sp.]CAB3818734.1 hypothetical protein LMG2828_00342 [Achromobacter piechaudii]
MSRTFTSFAEQDPAVKTLVNELPRLVDDVPTYRQHMLEIGRHLAESLFPKLLAANPKDICVICTVEDADFLARGLIEKLEAHHLGDQTHLICMWNARAKVQGVSISPVLRSYEESFDKDNAVFIIVKSIISGACVVKTNLTKAISDNNPKRIFIASPVMLKGAELRLQAEFPADVAGKFEFVSYATDSEKSADGEEVIPGVGGSVYERLGFQGEKDKNRYVPEIVRERRRKAYPEMYAV